ncbi:hypothetical protein GXW82_04375 [Streptacidiphilus sp. 4-A2]|nr:hypothetical protein [Streptacidiphilus sp. 4-A2]
MDRNVMRGAATAAVLLAGLAAAAPAQAATTSGRITGAQFQAHLAKAVAAEQPALIGSGPIAGYQAAIASSLV